MTGELKLEQAVALGLLHGPAELLPISSSGHVTLVPWLLGWGYPDLDPELRKSFEVVLHAGTAAALLIMLRDEVTHTVKSASPRLGMLIGLSFLPPAAAGYALEGPVERRLGRPASVAAGLVLGSLAMLAADRNGGIRSREEVTVADALWLGLAQASALIPGVSRSGATLAAARRRGFSRTDANILSRHVALPIIAAATARRVFHVRREGLPSGDRLAMVAGGLAAFGSTLGSRSILARVERERSLAPYAVYRLGLAGLALRRLRTQRSGAACHGSGR